MTAIASLVMGALSSVIVLTSSESTAKKFLYVGFLMVAFTLGALSIAF